MTKFVLTNCDIYTGESVLANHALVVSNGRIDGIVPLGEMSSSVEQIDLKGQAVSPGFIDLQVNGGGDLLFNDHPASAQIAAIRDAHRTKGTTDIMITYISGPTDGMRQASEAVAASIRGGGEGILGIHFEGPAISPKRAGVHDVGQIEGARMDELSAIYTEARECRTLVTLAPEVLPVGFISELVTRGVRVAVGHTDATYEQVLDAVNEGATGATHVWNAMSPLTSRLPGAVGAALADDRVWCGLIADGFHVDYTTLAISIRAKKRGRAFLVTDAMNPVGGTRGEYTLGAYHVRVVDGRCQTEDGNLAGSALDMATAVRNCIQKMGIPKDEAIRMATLYPAQFLGLQGQLGSIRPGFPAHLAIFDNEINVSAVVIEGKYEEVSARSQ